MQVTQHSLLELIQDKKLLIFDFDGTIANTEQFSWAAHKELLSKRNVSLTEQSFKKYIGSPSSQILEMIKKDFECDFDSAEYIERHNEVYRELILNSDLMPNTAIEYLLKEERGKRIVLLTCNTLFNVFPILEKWGLTELFDEFTSVSDNGITKTDYFNCIPKRWGLDYSDVVIFEDSVEVLSEAKSRRITTIGVEHFYNRGNLKDCDLIIKEPILR